MSAPILEIDDLRIAFASPDGIVRAVDGVSWQLNAGEMLGIVGESGCGKSVTAMSILRLLPGPPAMFASGAIRFRGEDLLTASEARMRALRGNAISMIFQDPMTSLNPVLTIGEQIAEVLILHQKLSKRAAWTRAGEMLDLVGIPDPVRRLADYPHQFSGGMRQRAMIALALACNPAVLIADEPTTALDVTIQAQIMELLARLRREMGTAIVLITHDLGVVAECCDRVVVMYAGTKVEEARVDALFARPSHPYTRGLLAAMPELDTPGDARHRRLAEIPGMVPSLKQAAVGCRFAPRCALADERCRQTIPALAPTSGEHADHFAACFRAHEPLPGTAA
ncbi:ABC transporter ATP-binding protein [Propionivibrio dicarboxylicus]|uniref:Peptide/nickel transport system ATP-binding protein n=1 Tax=Propionivibrio dicarboxylicus TaxID=83767 RepID=A0A1G7WVV4_9RHOO|nr:ABC transporter ATP-binding protein [Propionivibrio dicarboxylicus]SDG76072.1 peptide/nickel transport system ATP-binding protein [Propionivibrio dicarboxylicus]